MSYTEDVMASALLALLGAVAMGSSADMLPDITIWTDQLYDNRIDTTTLPGRTLFRLSTGTPNIGTGRLELRGSTVNGNGTQDVVQRIFRTDGTYWERLAGQFTHHTGHGHIHFNNWCKYRVRSILPGGGVGPILSEGQKTSFCILDLRVHNSSHPNYTNPGFYSGCGSVVQGLTPGWADIYSKNLTDQWVDVTGLPDGNYWLEAEVDPDNDILEADESNNIGRIQVYIGAPPPLTADAYEENDTRAQVDARAEGPNSPQLGLINATRVISNLSMQASDPDWFRFRINQTGGAGDYVQISSAITGGDIDMKLYDANGTQLAVSQSGSNNETITMANRPAGYYYVQVYPYSGTNSNYTFKVQPSGNLPPTITVLSPSKDIWVERSFDTVPIQWTTTDPENDPRNVTVYIDRDTTFDKGSIPVEGYIGLPAGDLGANLNTAEMPVGRWFMFLQVSDGGLTQTRRASGAFTLYMRGDLNWNGTLDQGDVDLMEDFFHRGLTRQRIRTQHGDVDGDGDFDHDDLHELDHIVNP